MNKKVIVKNAKACFIESSSMVHFYLKGDFGTPYEYNAYIEDGVLYIEECNKKICRLYACLSNFTVKINTH